jgi:hypothetical protein
VGARAWAKMLHAELQKAVFVYARDIASFVLSTHARTTFLRCVAGVRGDLQKLRRHFTHPYNSGEYVQPKMHCLSLY